MAAIDEAAAAAETITTGTVFSALVDNPASVGEFLDAYLGEIMLEAASATDTADAALPTTYTGTIAEAATATAVQDFVVGTVTLDPATVTAVTLSSGNLVATNTGTGSADQGARVASASGKTTGKYYFETTVTAATGGGNNGAGIGTTTSTYTNMGNNAMTGVEVFFGSGNIYANGSATGSTIGGCAAGTVVGHAIDLTSGKYWCRVRSTAGFWNGSSPADPATNVGGITIPAGTMVPFITFGGSGGAINNIITANFGASSFTGTVPSGFTSGWTA